MRQAGGIKGGVKRRKISDWEISERQEINRAALSIQAKYRTSSQETYPFEKPDHLYISQLKRHNGRERVLNREPFD